MKGLLVLLLLLTGVSSADDRVDQHVWASNQFFNWHFFENGRGMTISPDLARLMWMLNKQKLEADGVTKMLSERYGFQIKDNKLMGVFDVPYKRMRVGVLGCTACHSGKAAGKLYAGLGNKSIDAYLVGRDTKYIQALWGFGPRNRAYKKIHATAMNFAKVTSDKRISNLTRGLVSDATIKTFFYKDHGLKYPKDMGRAQVKVPHLWGLAQKRRAGVFNDGSLSGENYAWIFGAELFASDSGEHLRAILPRLEYLTEQVIGKLLPPKYPYAVDQKLAVKGRLMFARKCMGCHGPHLRDLQGHPIFGTPKVISNKIVKTDPEKLNSITDEFIRLVETGSLRDLLFFNQDKIRRGYFAPKLWGIWARFPYLHNGSVPTLYHMLLPPEQRPKIFSMTHAGEEYRFDKKFMGLSLYKTDEYEKAMKKAKRGDRNIYYVKREGQSNAGHYFKFMREYGHTDRMAILEYLKTL